MSSGAAYGIGAGLSWDGYAGAVQSDPEDADWVVRTKRA